MIAATPQPKRILIVDDNRINVELIKAQLKPFRYQLEEAYDGEEALQMINREPPNLVLLDLMMPKISGYEVCRSIKQNKSTQFIPVIVVTALQELDDKLKAIELGADDFIVKPFNKLELTTRITSLLKMKELHDDLDTSENILFSLVIALEAKDIYTSGHSERVADYAVALAKRLGLPIREVENIRKGGLLHDIGKIAVREEILSKEDKLTDDEMEQIKTHPLRGYDICKPLKSLEEILPCIKSHHERFDGKGYPEGIGGADIPLKGMIISVADTFDAMTTSRPYRAALTKEAAIKLLEDEMQSGQWNPDIVKAFLEMLRYDKTFA